jgi:hypothetical protein
MARLALLAALALAGACQARAAPPPPSAGACAELAAAVAAGPCHGAADALPAARARLAALGSGGAACLREVALEDGRDASLLAVLVGESFAGVPGSELGWLDDPEPRVRAAALGAIARRGSASPALLAAVEARLADPSPEVRGAAVSALAAAGSRESGPRMRPLLRDASPEVQRRAAYALRFLDGRRDP